MIRTLLASMLAVVFAMPAGSRLPRTAAETASGRSISLPDALQGRPAVLLVAFTKTAGEATAQWESRLARNYASTPQLALIRVAVLESIPTLLRRLARSRVQQNVPIGKRDAFILLFHHETDWKTLVQFDEPDDAYIVLLDAEGRISWHTPGHADAREYAFVTAHIDGLISAPSEPSTRMFRH